MFISLESQIAIVRKVFRNIFKESSGNFWYLLTFHGWKISGNFRIYGNFVLANFVSGYFFFKQILIVDVKRSCSCYAWVLFGPSRRGCLELVKKLYSLSFWGLWPFAIYHSEMHVTQQNSQKSFHNTFITEFNIQLHKLSIT